MSENTSLIVPSGHLNTSLCPSRQYSFTDASYTGSNNICIGYSTIAPPKIDYVASKRPMLEHKKDLEKLGCSWTWDDDFKGYAWHIPYKCIRDAYNLMKNDSDITNKFGLDFIIMFHYMDKIDERIDKMEANIEAKILLIAKNVAGGIVDKMEREKLEKRS